MAKKVSYAKLQVSSLFIPGGPGDIGGTLPGNSKTYPFFEMVEDGEKLVVELKTAQMARTVTFGIPLANVQLFVYAPEDKPSAAVKAVA